MGNIIGTKLIMCSKEYEEGKIINKEDRSKIYDGEGVPFGHHLYNVDVYEYSIKETREKYCVGEGSTYQAVEYIIKNEVLDEKKRDLKPSEFEELFGQVGKYYTTDRGFVVSCFGKYLPNIVLVINSKTYIPAYIPISKRGGVSVMYGRYYIAKKSDKKCFECLPKDKASHVLIKSSWGGSNCKKEEIDMWKIENKLHYRSASSNGGGRGLDYCVMPIDFLNQIHGI